jgi:maleylacetoacetate isomerase
MTDSYSGGMSVPELYTYYRSSAAYRVRIALGLKRLAWEPRPVRLARNGGEQFSQAYRALNPQALVPTLVDKAGPLTQSLAIIEYLEERYPDPPLLPAELHARAKVRAIAAVIACDIHPINNLRVLSYLRRELGADDAAVQRWYRHWIHEGLIALEQLAAEFPGRYCWGDAVTIADICLTPQLYNARRFDCDLTPFPRLVAIDARCRELPAFAGAAPERQGDADQPRL